MFDLEIIHARIVTGRSDFFGCISVEDGRIAAITEKPLRHAKQTIDAEGLVLLPGMIDQHVHFMDPGEVEREDFPHGTAAAASAGVTTVVEHTHGHPVRSLQEYREKMHHLRHRSHIDYGLAAHMWPGYFEELAALWQAGVMYFKAFTCATHGVPGLTNAQLYDAFSRVSSFGGRILVHCEDDSITHDNEARLRNAGRSDGKVVQEWRSEPAEEVAVSTVGQMAALTGAHVTIAHASHPAITQLVDVWRSRGALLHIEVCPQYMFLYDEIIQTMGCLGKFTPPSRSKGESDEMMNLLSEGKIDFLSTDHAPSTRSQKCTGDIWSCQFGLPGIETTFPLMLTAVSQGRLSLQRLVQAYSEGPARWLGLYPAKGAIQVGADADFILVDLDQAWEIRDERIVSKAGWSPYTGMQCRGKVVKTFVRGTVVMLDGQMLVDPGYGKPVQRVK